MIARWMLGAALAAMAAAAGAQTVNDEDEREAQRARYAATRDTPGTGPYPAIKEVDPALPNHVVYRPANLDAFGERKLGLLIWGNGGCSDDGASARLHLLQIASYGYLVIAPGRIRSGPGAEPEREPRRQPGPSGSLPPVSTTTSDLVRALDWALAENKRAESAYSGLVDESAVAVAGHSCGGLQAIEAGADPRVRTVMVHNSGIFADGSNPIPGLTVAKSMLLKLHTPVLYVLGGPSDIAYPNGTDDFEQIAHVPAVLISSDVGHGGTFQQSNGGSVAEASVDWLEWQLRNDARAARTFEGRDCRLCTAPGWTVQQKGF